MFELSIVEGQRRVLGEQLARLLFSFLLLFPKLLFLATVRVSVGDKMDLWHDLVELVCYMGRVILEFSSSSFIMLSDCSYFVIISGCSIADAQKSLCSSKQACVCALEF